jgi:cell division protein ZapA
MKTAQGGVTVSILGKEFVVACPEGEREALNRAARYLDQQMRKIQEGGKVLGIERCAVMAALNLSNELLALQQQSAGPDTAERLERITGKIDAALREAQDLNA